MIPFGATVFCVVDAGTQIRGATTGEVATVTNESAVHDRGVVYVTQPVYDAICRAASPTLSEDTTHDAE